jgi:hypothetical protein
MSIYLGDNKVTGAGVQLDNTLNAYSNNAVTNAAITAGLSEVGYNSWQRPADWVDIRSGALDNSIYFLVGHAADYSKYPKFAVNATISNSGTYDVYVDGLKQAATASATDTILNWQTLALTSGFDTTHPEELRTHIVRVTPSAANETIMAIRLGDINGQVQQGILWAHFNIINAINLDYVFNSANHEARLLESITSSTGEIIVSEKMRYAFRRCNSLVNIPILNGNNTEIDASRICAANTSIKKIYIKNITLTGEGQFSSASALEQILCDNAKVKCAQDVFSSTTKLKRLPSFDFKDATVLTGFIYQCSSLENTFIDASNGTNITNLRIYGTNVTEVLGIKGVTVSPLAPFSSLASPQININYTGLNRAALLALFNSLPTVSAGQVCSITGATGANDLTAEDLAIATSKGWTVTR